MEDRTAHSIYRPPHLPERQYRIAHTRLTISRWLDLRETIERSHDCTQPRHSSRVEECEGEVLWLKTELEDLCLSEEPTPPAPRLRRLHQLRRDRRLLVESVYGEVGA